MEDEYICKHTGLSSIMVDPSIKSKNAMNKAKIFYILNIFQQDNVFVLYNGCIYNENNF